MVADEPETDLQKRIATGAPMTALALPVVSSRESCTCERCVGCCERSPGLMLPGEAQKIADYLGVSVPDLHATKLMWRKLMADSGKMVYCLSPVGEGTKPGTTAWAGGGRCVFLEFGRCRIHAVKPFECRGAWCGDGPVDFLGSETHRAINAWATPVGKAERATLAPRKNAKSQSPKGGSRG